MNGNYEWLAHLKANSWSLECNEHACNYVTAKEWIEEFCPDEFADTPAALVDDMKAANRIFRLQIYPDTPIGFYYFYGPTLDSVIEQARATVRDSADSVAEKGKK